MSGVAHEIRVRLGAHPIQEVRGFDLKLTAVGREQAFDREAELSVSCFRKEVRVFEKEKAGQKGATPALTRVQKFISFRGPLRVESPAGFFSLRSGGTGGSRRMRDRIAIHPITTTSGHTCEIVNELDLEKYLDGVVNAEFNSNWSSEAIAAQVIAARTYALFQIRDGIKKYGRDRKYDVEATTQDQVYGGAESEDHRASQAIAKTSGMVLTHAGEPIKAFYHSTCGGHTELPEKVWGGKIKGVGKSVKCPYCRTSPRFEWQTELDSAAVRAAFLDSLPIDSKSAGKLLGWPSNYEDFLKGGELVAIAPLRIDPTGRAEIAQMKWVRAGKEITLNVPAPIFRTRIGATKMRSTAFQSLSLASGKVLLKGVGNGHGVGMCQWGAKTMGESGSTLGAILSFYYPESRIKKLW